MGWYQLRNRHARIFRPIRKIDYRLSLQSATFDDVTGADVWCRLIENSSGVLLTAAQSFDQTVGTLEVPKDVDIARGYVLLLHRLRTVAGVREAVAATLTANAASGTKALTVSTTVGFRPGDQCVIVPVSGDEFAFRVKAVSSTQLTLHDDQELPANFVTGDSVVDRTLWAVQSNIQPQTRKGPNKVVVRQYPYWDID